jgi:hypothetical protein
MNFEGDAFEQAAIDAATTLRLYRDSMPDMVKCLFALTNLGLDEDWDGFLEDMKQCGETRDQEKFAKEIEAKFERLATKHVDGLHRLFVVALGELFQARMVRMVRMRETLMGATETECHCDKCGENRKNAN